MALQIRRGTNADRLIITPLEGELIYTTDTNEVFVGDGVTLGGINIRDGSTSEQLTISDVQDIVGPMLTDGVHTNISFTYDEEDRTINAVVTPDGVGLINVVEDLTPQLGGNLDLNGFNIDGTGNLEINGEIKLIGNSLPTLKITIKERAEGSVIQSNDEELVLESSSASSGAQVRINLDSSATSSGSNYSLLTGLAGLQFLELRSYKDGVETPGDVGQGDILGSIAFSGWIETTQSNIACIVGAQVDPDGTITSTHLPTKIFLGNQAATEGNLPVLMTFDSFGRLAVNQETAQATCDINGVMRLAPQAAAPSLPVEGMIAIANRVDWDPASVGSGGSYPVYFDGASWSKLT